MSAIMTGREHLQMYALLRGIPTNDATAMAQQLLDDLNLVPVADKVYFQILKLTRREGCRDIQRWQQAASEYGNRVARHTPCDLS
jgi:hypothetical protein